VREARPDDQACRGRGDTDGMRAAGIRTFGGPIEQLDLPEPPRPGTDGVLVEIRGAGIGNWDDLVRTGAWDIGIRPPMALGVEAAGIVGAVGSGVSRFAVGDEVLVHSTPLRYQGAWAERFLAPEAHVAAKPPTLSWSEAALLPVPLLTAARVVSQIVAPTAADVLVHGAGGVTGGLVVVLAAQAGHRVIATCSSASVDRVRRYGAAETVDYESGSWMANLRGSFPRGFAAVIVAVRGTSASLLPLVADGGQLITITGDPPPSERGIAIRNEYVAPDGPSLGSAANVVARLGVTIPLAETVGLAEVGGALQRVSSAEGGGGRVVDPRR
jgi:NADPH:quinone reductase-like Zn-dependent oxidoreductase